MGETTATGDQMLVVLEKVAQHGPLTAARVAVLCDINRTVAHRLLTTLSKHSFVAKLKDGYILGSRAYDLAQKAQPSLITEARPIMQALAGLCCETVVLHGASGRDAVVLDQVAHSGHLVGVYHAPGSRHPIYRGASGWSQLAFLDARAQSRILAELPEAERGAAEERIAQVRRAGWALSQDELQLGVCGIAAPVFGADGTCVASLAIIVPLQRQERLDTFLDKLLSAAKDVSAALQRNRPQP